MSKRADAPTRSFAPSAWVEVDLDRLAGNLALLRGAVAPAEVLPVIKADAYGHGAIAVARRLADEGIERVAVARLEEAVELRDAGIEGEIIVLGPSRRSELSTYESRRVTPVLSSLEQLDFWVSDARTDSPVHLKFDTGMHRLGIPSTEVDAALAAVRAEGGPRLVGFCSHLAEGESPDSPKNEMQERRFESLVEQLTDEERARVLVHLGASSTALHLKYARHDTVRVGLALYGYDSAALRRGLEPVLSVRGELLDVREIKAGESVGYDSTWTAREDTRLGVLGVGYADGLARALSNRGEALVGGCRVPIVGRISMDLTIVDLGALAAEPGDEFVLLGRQGGESIDAAEIASSLGTIPYEVLCALGSLRLPRRFVEGERDGSPRAFDRGEVGSRPEPS